LFFVAAVNEWLTPHWVDMTRRGEVVRGWCCKQVVGSSAAGRQASSQVAASDVVDKLSFVSQSYDADTTYVIADIDQFRRTCSTYDVDMFTALSTVTSPPHNDDNDIMD